MALTQMRSPLLTGTSPEEKRAEIRRYFHNTYDTYEQLFTVMAGDEAYFRRADPLRHPLIFYFGHTATFFVNKLVLAKILARRIDPHFESIFAIGVDEMSWDDLDERNYDWPTVAEVKAYRDEVRSAVDAVITELPLQLPIGWDSPFWPIIMGCEHERIHLETSSVIIRQLPLEMVRSSEEWPVCTRTGEAPANTLLPIPAGQVVLGKKRDDRLYGWDNEYGHLERDMPAFQAARYLVSNQEFMPFVAAGGYRDQQWWTDEGWRWREYRQAEYPVFWVAAGPEQYRLRTLTSEIPLPADWPVEVNYLEAKAFCNWLAARTERPIRLPTEEEWYRLLDHCGVPDQPDWDSVPGNIDLAHGASSTPVTDHEQGGFGDVVGNVWQWTETPIAAFPGFAVHPLYDDFSTPTFDTQHNLIKGGSWISTGNEATRQARYAFRRHFFQHAGFRYISSEAPVQIRADVYETDALISQYCEFHYGPEYFGVPSFPVALAAICRELSEGRARGSALDLGCATGRASFELARDFEQVTGIDFSARFIRIGLELQEKGYTRYALPEEGELVSYHERRLDDLDLTDCAERVEFWQGDAHNLKPRFTGYDLILAANLIDRLYDPARFLTAAAERLAPGGLLVIASPYTWLEEFTPRDAWLGARKIDGENVSTLAALHEALAPRFRPVGEPRDVPFVIRETRRMYQHTISQVTAWRLAE